MTEKRPSLWTRLLDALERMQWGEDAFDTILVQRATIDRLHANNASLSGSLDDANATIKRLSAEKAALVRVIQTVKENIGAY